MSELLRIFASAHTGNVLRRALALAETGSTRMMWLSPDWWKEGNAAFWLARNLGESAPDLILSSIQSFHLYLDQEYYAPSIPGITTLLLYSFPSWSVPLISCYSKMASLCVITNNLHHPPHLAIMATEALPTLHIYILRNIVAMSFKFKHTKTWQKIMAFYVRFSGIKRLKGTNFYSCV